MWHFHQHISNTVPRLASFQLESSYSKGITDGQKLQSAAQTNAIYQ